MPVYTSLFSVVMKCTGKPAGKIITARWYVIKKVRWVKMYVEQNVTPVPSGQACGAKDVPIPQAEPANPRTRSQDKSAGQMCPVLLLCPVLIAVFVSGAIQAWLRREQTRLLHFLPAHWGMNGIMNSTRPQCPTDGLFSRLQL